MVWSLALVLVAGHAYDIVVQREHWPFSYYQMYARVQKKRRLELLGLYAIVQDHKRSRQIAIDQTYIPQLGETRMRNILMASWGRVTSPNPTAVRDTARILRDYLKLYESRRLSGLHDGPPMLEAQLCKVSWVVKEGAAGKKPKVEPLIGVRADGKLVRYPALTTQQANEKDAGDDAIDR